MASVLDKVLEPYNNLDCEREGKKGKRSKARERGEPRADPTDPDYPVNILKVLRGSIVGKVGRPAKPRSQLARIKEQDRAKLRRLLRPLTGHDPIIPMTFDKPSHR